jgi:hypothetical protein
MMGGGWNKDWTLGQNEDSSHLMHINLSGARALARRNNLIETKFDF